MADSSLVVTPGTGQTFDTRTESTNSNHRAVCVLGDPSDNAGVAPVDGTAGLKVDLGADNDVTVTGSVTANAGTNLDTSALALESGGNLATVAAAVAAEGAALGSGVLLQGDDGTDRKNINVDATTGDVQVDVTNTVTVDATSSGDVPITLAGETVTVDLGANNDVTATGNVAHDAADSGNPLKIGGKAKETDGTDPGSVAEDDRVDAIFDRNGRQLVNTVHPNYFNASENRASAQTNNELVAAPGAGLKLYITDVVISNGATAGSIKFVEDTAGTPVDVIEELYLAANGGAPLHFNTPIVITANTNFGFTSTTVTTHSVTVCGYTAP